MPARKMFKFAIAAIAAATSLAFAPQSANAQAQVQPPADDAPLYNVALSTLGALATGSGSHFNNSQPPSNVVDPPHRYGAIFGTSETIIGARIDVRPIIPVDLEAAAISQLDYGHVRSPKAFDVYVNGKKVSSHEMPLQQGKLFHFPLKAKNVEEVGIVVTDQYPPKDLGDGKFGPGWGGWGRIQLLSKTDLSVLMAPPAAYAPVIAPQALAASQKEIAGEVKVYGEPRKTVGHPNTIWDKQDIAELQAMIKTSPELKKQYEALKAGMTTRMTQPLGIPPAVKDADGNYIHVSDSVDNRGGIHNQLATDIANLAAVYALSGEEKYGDFAKKLLLAYAAEFPNYAPGNRPGFAHDVGKAFDQRLGDSIWVIQLARAYDLIYNLPSMTAEERALIVDDLLIACADFIKQNVHHIRNATNWSAISTAAVLIIGYATDTERLINDARWGIGGTPEKPTGGVHLHFSEKAIDIDGMWAEGAMGYQFMALQALITDAEILWHHGEDMYRYRNGALKSLFDSPLEFSYPDLYTPAIHDSGNASIVGYDSYLYEHAYRRYRDPKYLAILSRVHPHLAARYQQWPVSVIYDAADEAAPAVEWDSVNLNGVGYGILRTTDERGTRSLLLDYGPDRSHGHPDKLNIDLWLYGDILIPDPGIVWYEDPLYRNWFSQTLAHNTLIVDQKNQLACGADQLVYGPALTLGIQRAKTSGAYPGVTMDRAIFLTSDYTADIFGAFAQLPRQLDLAWHIRGDFTTTLKLADTTFPAPVPAAYATLENTQQADGSKPWTAEFVHKDKTYRFHSSGAKDSQIIVGDGLFWNEKPKTIIDRRDKTNQTIYGAVLDHALTDKPYIKKVETLGSLADGYGALHITTADGIDTAYAAYRPAVKIPSKIGIDTDASQAIIRRKNKAITAAYLGGGTTLKADKLLLTRDTPGLLSLELVENGSYILSNPSPTATVARVAYAPLNKLEAYKIAPNGAREDNKAAFQQDRSASDAYIIPMPAGARYEFAAAGTLSLHDYRAKVLADRAAADAAAAQKAIDEINARDAIRLAASAESPLPPNTIIAIQAETYTAEGGGKINTLTDRIGAIGAILQGWDASGHWLEWTIEAPSEGYYNFAICYAQEPGETTRRLIVNGEDQEPSAPMHFKGTGGWARSSDDWRLHTALNPVSEKPLLLKFKAGANTIRIKNESGQGANLDYLAIFSPDVTPTRDLLSAKIEK